MMVEDCGSSNNGTVILYIITTATIDCLQYASNQKTGVGNAQYMRLVLTMRVVVVSSSANNSIVARIVVEVLMGSLCCMLLYDTCVLLP